MKILLLGENGQLGWELRRALPPLGELSALDYPQIDLSKPDELRATLQTLRPEVIINATAYTAVDRAETERDLAYAINAAGPGILAEEAKKLGAALIHFSTDYVFDGTKGSSYTENDSPHPLSVYGASKLAGEEAIRAVDGIHLIFRTAWVYSLSTGAVNARQDGFITKVLQWLRKNETLKIVDDQISNPTWARALAQVTALLLARAGSVSGARAGSVSGARAGGDFLPWLAARRGLYHLAGSGFASRLDWAQKIRELDPHPEEQVCRQILPAATSDFSTPAQRPLFSALDCSRFEQTFNLRLPAWQDALRLAMGK
ncbi:MAG: dTDP-4-dehydrorhamnose reductase [Anaerolineales bacterium]